MGDFLAASAVGVFFRGFLGGVGVAWEGGWLARVSVCFLGSKSLGTELVFWVGLSAGTGGGGGGGDGGGGGGAA